MKKTCWNYIGRLVSHCLFSKWHKESDLFAISALSKDDLCAQHHAVKAYEEAQTLPSPVNSNIVSEIIIIQQQKKLFCFASCSGYSHHQKLFRSHESGLSHNNLVSLRAFGQNHRRRRIYSLFSGTDEAATESLVNKRKFNSNTHMKSVNGFFFSRTFSHLFFLRWVENSVNQ